MMGLVWARLALLWPVHVALVFIIPVIATIFIMFFKPTLRYPLLVVWTYLFLSTLSSQAYSNPNSWFLRSVAQALLPTPKELGWKYVDRSGFDHNQQAIYVWYPHGHLGVGALGSIVAGLGNNIWKRPNALCVAPISFDIPAFRHFSLALGLVRSDLENMQNCLAQGTSLTVLAGGLREMKMTEPGTMKLVDGRRGILRLARKMKVPLIPVFSIGENELFDGRPVAWQRELSNVLETWNSSLTMPSWSSMSTWLRTPLGERPLRIVLGMAFRPEEFPETMDAMAAEWKMHVSLAYEMARGKTGAPLTWIPAIPKNKKENSVLDAEL